MYLKDETPDSWSVLYSLWLASSDKKNHAEVDFLVITETACFCLEVKGHKVWRDERSTWHFETLDGKKNRTSNEGPFDQAKEAYYAVGNHLKSLRKETYFYDFVWGYGVVTPDCALEIPLGDALLDPAMLADLRIFPEKMDSYFLSMSDYWRERVFDQKKKVGKRADDVKLRITAAAQEDLVLTLRPVLRPLTGVGITSLQAVRESKVLTEQQYIALDHSALEPRILLHGTAGTGKTLIAFEQARRVAVNERVLFICFNSNLAEVLNSKCSDLQESNITVLNYHQLVTRLLRDAEIAFDISTGWQNFNSQALELVCQALERLNDFRSYDYLVVDEAQDLLTEEFFDVLDLLLLDGIVGGRWCLCVDPEQMIYNSQFDEVTYSKLVNQGRTISLTVNCRNTKPIAAYFAGISNIAQREVRASSGPDVVLDYYDDFEGYEKLLKKYVNSLVTEYKQAKLSPTDIVILTSDKQYVLDVSKKILTELVLPLVPYHRSLKENQICWSTVHAYKGLEAMAVILVGITDLHSIESRRLFYVGASRARTHLVALLPNSTEDQIIEALPRIMSALNGRLV
jgi:hypothetical protein